MTVPVQVGGWTVHCGDCDHLLIRSRYSQEAADEQAMEAGFGISGQWLCDGCAEKKRNPRGDYCLTEGWAYANSYDWSKVTTARKPHQCQRNCIIRPGQQYIETVIPPWAMIADDVDEEGRTIGSRNGEWTRTAFHRYADEHNTDGKES